MQTVALGTSSFFQSIFNDILLMQPVALDRFIPRSIFDVPIPYVAPQTQGCKGVRKRAYTRMQDDKKVTQMHQTSVASNSAARPHLSRRNSVFRSAANANVATHSISSSLESGKHPKWKKNL